MNVDGRVAGRWLVPAALVAVVAGVAHLRLLGFTPLYGLFGNGVDAVVYRYGGESILDGRALYAFRLFDTELPFTYPPFAALVFTALAAMSVMAALSVVAVANCVLVYLATVLSWRILGYRGWGMHCVSVCMAVGFTWLEPVRMTVWLGQINLLLLVVVLWDLGRPTGSRLRGVGVGLAAGIKLTPAFFVLFALAVRQWRTAATAVGTFAVTVFVGAAVVFDDARTYWTSAIFQSDRIGWLPSPANQSVHGVLARAWPGGNPPPAVWIACACVVGALGLWGSVLAYRRGAVLLSLTLCGLTTPMVSPFSWGHHWVWCVPLVVLALDFAARSPSRLALVVPVLTVVPFVAWFYLDGDVAVIGTFMLDVAAPFSAVTMSVYPIVFVVVLVSVLLASRNRAPRVEFALERHRRIRGTRRREAVQHEIGVGDPPNEVGLGGGAVEEHSLDTWVSLEQAVEIVDDDRRRNDRGIETAPSGAEFQNVPDGDAVAAQRGGPVGVRQIRVERQQ